MESLGVFAVREWLARDQNNHGRFVRVVRPRQLGCWTKTSLTEGSQYLYESKDGLHTYQDPQLPADLNEGYPATFVRKPGGESTPVEVIMRAALSVQAGGQLLTKANICSFRNNLNKIFGAPLNLDDSWAVDGCLHSGTLYLDIVKGEEKEFPDSDRFMYYGYKFESLCTGAPPGSKVDATSEFASLLGLQVGPHRILMAAEIDCTEAGAAAAANPVDAYLELKTYKLPQHPGQEARMYEDKYPRWWLQSFLAGVPTLVLGGRDGDGTLQKVEKVAVSMLPSTAAAAAEQSRRRQPFDAHQLLRFGTDCLSWMLEQAAARPEQHLRFDYSKGSIQCSAVPGGDMPTRISVCLAGP